VRLPADFRDFYNVRLPQNLALLFLVMLLELGNHGDRNLSAHDGQPSLRELMLPTLIYPILIPA